MIDVIFFDTGWCSTSDAQLGLLRAPAPYGTPIPVSNNRPPLIERPTAECDIWNTPWEMDTVLHLSLAGRFSRNDWIWTFILNISWDVLYIVPLLTIAGPFGSSSWLGLVCVVFVVFFGQESGFKNVPMFLGLSVLSWLPSSVFCCTKIIPNI